MTSTRKSKKGFKKLENHELAEFTSLGNGTGLGDSGSETDLLDLTVLEEGESRVRWNSCCCWCSALYFGLLTCLFVLLGLYCGYLTFNLWQMTDATTTTHSGLDSRLANIEGEMKHYKTAMSRKYSALQQELWSLRDTLNQTKNSLQSVHGSMGNSLEDLRSKVNTLEERLKVLESKPQEMLIKQVDTINKDMGVMNASMRQLNRSLADIKAVKTQMAGLESITNSYDDQLRTIKESIGGVRQENKEMRDSVDAAVSTAAGFKTRIDSIDSALTSSDSQMQQTTDLLTAQVTSVKLSVTALNESLSHEVDSLWANVTTINTLFMERFPNGSLSGRLQGKLELLQNQTPDSFAETMDHTPTAPPPTVTPSSESEVPATVKEEVMETVPSSEPTTPPPATPSPTTPPPTTVPSSESTTLPPATPSPTTPTPTTVPSSESTTLPPATPPPTTLPPGSTESTGATEDSIPFDNEVEDGGTPSSVMDNEVELIQKEVEIERDIIIVSSEINKTTNAINLLQSFADKFNSLDLDDTETIDADEFYEEIPTQRIFELLDSDKDDQLTYNELLTNINELRLKLNELQKELKTLQGIEEEVEETEEGMVKTSDPVLQKKLMELYKFIMNPNKSAD